GGLGRVPAARAVEDDDVAWLNRPEMVDELADQDLVADIQRVLHGAARNDEGLNHERLDHDREHERDDDEQRQLAHERPATGPGRAAKRCGAIRSGCAAGPGGTTGQALPRGAPGSAPPYRAARGGSTAWRGAPGPWSRPRSSRSR